MALPYLNSEQIKQKHELINRYLIKPSSTISKELEEGYFSKYIIKRYGRDAKILELGCASGIFLKALAVTGFRQIKGVDIDNYLKFPELNEVLLTLDLNKNSLPFQDKSMDVVCAFQIFEHLENPFSVEREVARVLRPGGLFILSMPNGHTIWDKLRFFISGNLQNYHLKNNHITFLTQDVFTKTFLKDFNLEKTIYDHGWTPWIRPRKITSWLNQHLPPWRLWSLNKCHFLIKK